MGIRHRQLDLQTKIVLVLVAVIVPTFLIVTLVQHQVTRPLLQSEMRQVGIAAGQALATKITASRWLNRRASWIEIDREIQEQIYWQPSIFKLEVFIRDPASGLAKLIASNIEEDPNSPQLVPVIPERVASALHEDESGARYWEVQVPILTGGRQGKTIGMVNLAITTRSINRLVDAFWKITAVGAMASVVILIVTLNFFLKKTIANERRLRAAETHNLELSQQLHETQRQLMNFEKLAVIGQLTANVAHEIGTPLNAIGGHLHLLKQEVIKVPSLSVRVRERMEIIAGELKRIEGIVRGFLQTHPKPTTQPQLVDVNSIIDKTLGIVRPRTESMGVQVESVLDRKMGPLRAVPLEFEQVLLNLFNNSLDSMEAKSKVSTTRLRLRISTSVKRSSAEEWASITVYDTGSGIRRTDLKNVTKPFFTTKGPGEGTGLGLTICRELIEKYGGDLELKSREGSWTHVRLSLPYRAHS